MLSPKYAYESLKVLSFVFWLKIHMLRFIIHFCVGMFRQRVWLANIFVLSAEITKEKFINPLSFNNNPPYFFFYNNPPYLALIFPHLYVVKKILVEKNKTLIKNIYSNYIRSIIIYIFWFTPNYLPIIFLTDILPI